MGKNERRSKSRSEKSIGIAFIGRASYTEPSASDLGNSLTVLDCHDVSEKDVEVKNCIVVGQIK